MENLYRSRASRALAAMLLGLSLASGGYFFLPAQPTIAQAPAATAPPAEALNQANTLSDAFRNSADKVLPAVVSIRNEVQPKLAKADRGGESRSQRGVRPQLPKGFGELDPFLKRFFDELPEGGGTFDVPQGPRLSSGSGVIIDPS